MLKRNSVTVHLLARELGLEIWRLSKVRTRPAGRIFDFGNFLIVSTESSYLLLWEHIFLTEHSLHYAEFSS